MTKFYHWGYSQFGTQASLIADGYPFDIEFWQVNKALGTAGLVVKQGGVIIIVSPCYEGVSKTHPEIMQYGYRPLKELKEIEKEGKLDLTVLVHLIQVSRVIKEKARCILVSPGISKKDKIKLGLLHADTPQEALDMALSFKGKKSSIAVLRRAGEMLPILPQ